MYMVDGKPIQVPYGRRNVNVTKLELEDTVSALVARIEALEALVKDGSNAITEPVQEQVEQEQIADEEPVTEEETEVEQTEEIAEAPTGEVKPRRGRKPKEATE